MMLKNLERIEQDELVQIRVTAQGLRKEFGVGGISR